MENFERVERQIWAARTRAAINGWLGWLGGVLLLDENSVLPCNSFKNGGKFLLTGWSAPAKTVHNDLVVKGEESPGHSFTATSEVSAHLYVTPGYHLYGRHSAARKRLLNRPFVMEAIKISSRSVFVGYA